MIRSEGEDWECYFGEGKIDQYKRALQNSIVYVAYAPIIRMQPYM